MSVLKWLEKTLFSGEVLHDYGNIQDESAGIARSRTSVQLCRRSGRLQLVFRNVSTAILAVSVRYWTIEVTPGTLRKLGEILADATKKLEESPIPK